MNRRFDLNLLPIAVALYEERGVSKTAARLGMSQPAVSAALAKLRKALGDPLFIRTAHGMEPTPRAQALIMPARDVLSRVEHEVLSGPGFDPTTTNATFTVALSDVGEMVFLPRILERLQNLAPRASLRSVSPPPSELREGLETGDVDLAVGYFPDLETSNLFQQRLFTHHFCCLLRADHPIANARLSLKQFLALKHIVVHAAGRSQEIFERFLLKTKIHPKVVLVTPHFLSLPMIIAKTDLVATVPHAVGMYFSGSRANIKVVLPPFSDAPRIVLKQHWHRKANHDPRNRWLRLLVSELFTQESDEWKTKRADGSLSIRPQVPLFDASIATISGCGLRLRPVSSIVVEDRVRTVRHTRHIKEGPMRFASIRLVTSSLLGLALIAPAIPAAAKGPKVPPAPVSCAALTAADSDLLGSAGVKSAESHLVAAVGTNAAYCQVNILYGENPNQNINVRVGLPLNSVDGGTGGVQGAWNGRTQGIGGGGCSGSLGVNAPVNARYVGSGSDAGHTGGNCEPGVNDDGTYNYQFINDFIRNGMKQQILLSKAVTNTYYAQKPAYNYWNGCSTGGRQGYVLAQELPKELDGILANAPAIYWTRFQTAQMWGQIVMKDLVGAPITVAKLNQATTSAVAACDAADGVVDGVIDDPRTCSFSATANVCGSATAPAANCLTPAEAEAIDKIWDGPRNAKGSKVWFGLDRGTSIPALNGNTPFALGVTQFHWDEHDKTFDWKTVSIAEYPDVHEDGSRNIADVTDTFGDLKEYEKSHGKLLTLVGANDQLIMPRGVINYYREQATDGHKTDFKKQQKFYRLFRAPGAGHCGVPNAFSQLVDWVENGVAPEQIIAASPGRTRLLCPYPQTAIYNGTGDNTNAANYHCGGDLETTATVCADVLAKYKHEAKSKPDYKSAGVKKHECEPGKHDDDDDDDDAD